MLEVSRFLGSHPPFSGLGADRLEQVSRTVEVEFFSPGTVILEQDGAPADHVYVVRRGAVELLDGSRVVDMLHDGDVFGFPSMLSGRPPANSVRARDETLCYLVPAEQAKVVFSGPSGMQFLTMALRQRASNVVGGEWGEFAVVIGDIARGPLVVVDGERAVSEVAREMTGAGASAAVVESEDGVGIVTDRDIRAKVVAAGLDPGEPVRRIATARARTVRSDEGVEAALVRMLELGVHHLPLVDDGRVVGMITDLDLVGHRRRRSFQLRSEIERAPDVAGVAAAGRRIPDSLLPLIRAGVDPEHLGVITATLVDGLTIRLIELAQEALGPAPAPYAWIALGSAGRRDQGLTSDQDHALVYAGESDEPDDWYQRMAELVVEGLESAGFPRCASKVMASEDGWRGPESWWRARIEQWMMVDDLKAAFLTATAFDGRVAAGDLDVRPLFAAAVNGAAASPPFLRRLERLIAEVKVPVGFLGNLVVSDEGETGTLDIKRGGIHPVNEMARLFALQGGIPSVGTVRRLREAVMAGTVEADAAEGLEEALGLFREVRVKHQAEQWAGGRLPDDLVRPDDLGPLERRALRDAFRLVRDVQRDIGGRLHPRVLGR